ncbi:hypothetical protein [Stackebrandtia albiflava]|nr:hypothetical protein [Stackebrandtia albiflava]
MSRRIAADRHPRGEHMPDIAHLALTVALFAVLAAAVKAVEKL